jgi:integrase
VDSNVAEVNAVEAVAVAVAAQPKKKKPAKKVAGLKANKGGVTAYETKKGVRFLAQVRLAGRKPVSKSFGSFDEATKWKKSQEITEVPVATNKVPEDLTIAQFCLNYLTEAEARKKPVSYWRSTFYNRMATYAMFQENKLCKVGFDLMHDYCEWRINVGGVDPSSVTSEFAYLKVAIRRMSAWLKWGTFAPLEGVRAQLREDNLVADSNERKRRPSAEESDKLRAYFREQAAMKHPKNYIHVPMVDICDVAALNAFRRGELVALTRTAIDRAYSTIACRRKDSSAKDGTGKRDTKVPLLESSLAIIDRQPKGKDDRIFPYSAGLVSKRFAEACLALGINVPGVTSDAEWLVFHDLRHEAISTAAQHISTLSQLMALSGHKTAKHLGRYIQHSNEDLQRIGGMMTYGPRTAIAAGA